MDSIGSDAALGSPERPGKASPPLIQVETAGDATAQKAPAQVLLIIDTARDCWEAFGGLLNQIGTEAPLTQRLVTEYQQRYESWASFLGVFAKERLNLDRRLRHSPEVKSLVMQQLNLAKRNLDAGKLDPTD